MRSYCSRSVVLGSLVARLWHFLFARRSQHTNSIHSIALPSLRLRI